MLKNSSLGFWTNEDFWQLNMKSVMIGTANALVDCDQSTAPRKTLLKAVISKPYRPEVVALFYDTFIHQSVSIFWKAAMCRALG